MDLPDTFLNDGYGLPTTRRSLLIQAAAALSGLALPAAARAQAAAHSSLGLIEPRLQPPPLPLTLHDGRSTRLEDLLRGKVTALQLMFTGCSSTCPIQGAVFAGVQARLASQAVLGAQLLSVSIDPLSDDARQLAAWRQRFNAGPQWLAASPSVQHNDRLPDFLSSRPPPGKAAAVRPARSRARCLPACRRAWPHSR